MFHLGDCFEQFDSNISILSIIGDFKQCKFEKKNGIRWNFVSLHATVAQRRRSNHFDDVAGAKKLKNDLPAFDRLRWGDQQRLVVGEGAVEDLTGAKLSFEVAEDSSIFVRGLVSGSF